MLEFVKNVILIFLANDVSYATQKDPNQLNIAETVSSLNEIVMAVLE